MAKWLAGKLTFLWLPRPSSQLRGAGCGGPALCSSYILSSCFSYLVHFVEFVESVALLHGEFLGVAAAGNLHDVYAADVDGRLHRLAGLDGVAGHGDA